MNELQENGKYEELQIRFKEEKIKHLKELYNARASKLSPEVLAMMNTETKAKSKTQENYSEVMAPQRVSSPSNARNTIPDTSDTYLVPQFQEKFEQLAKAAIQEITERETEAWAELILLSEWASHPSERKSE